MARAWDRKFFLAALMKSAYFPRELPPVFTTSEFADFCENEFKAIHSDSYKLKSRDTNYATYTAPRTGNGRRALAIVNPSSQLNLALNITLHRSKIKKLIKLSGTSLYSIEEDRKGYRAFKGLDFRKWDSLVHEVCSKHPYILVADVSRFFYTAYTHSIPWAVVGKEKVKDWLRLPWNKSPLAKHWSNSIDRSLQLCQSRETFGLPVGPDTSRVIAEVLMSGVEGDQEYLALTDNRTALRLIDDFVIGFDNRDDAIRTLRALRKALWKFNLQLNEEKTGVFQSSEILRERWKLEFDLKIPEAENAKDEREQVDHLINLTLHLCAEYKTDTPAIFACERFQYLLRFDENFGVLVDAAMRFARDYPACTEHAVLFLIESRLRCRKLGFDGKIEDWVKHEILKGIESDKDHEMAWFLYLVGAFRFELQQSDLGSISTVPNPIVFSLLGLLREHKLLKAPLSSWKWRATIRDKEYLAGEYWLPLYESVLRGWTKDKKLIAEVASSRLMSELRKNNISFLDDTLISLAEKINLDEIDGQTELPSKRDIRISEKRTKDRKARDIIAEPSDEIAQGEVTPAKDAQTKSWKSFLEFVQTVHNLREVRKSQSNYDSPLNEKVSQNSSDPGI